ncbi:MULTISPECIES: hypothetical protein [Serratia]|uniref:hypothetical protein n=1 Tax=Serratia TaxID=613 RepID=UPI000668F59A|nr:MULTISPECIES: hypothetical protein [Serratia]MEB6081081.1 hypothetical protein [Serratia marcescens]NIA33847.1 hypothetical protein [Serratia marcescens]TBU67992.1 hypothetical protein EG355_09160 [Serratia marcescens]TXE65473.1 hypothetical protein FOT58_03650 [Serratia nematodiphila]WGL93334.1 hypothetical protein QFB85_10700 [Serratia marcescens]
MNYQVVPFWFYSGKVLLAVLAAIGLGLCGVNAAIFYCLLLGVVWPVAVSIRLHQLTEKGLAMNPRRDSHWMVYVQGIPVQETRQVLTNPCFALEYPMQIFFLRAFAGKTVLQMALLLLLITQLAAATYLWVALAGALFGVWLVYRTVDSVRALRDVARQRWVSEQLVTAHDTVWYRAAFNGRKDTVAALDRLLTW